MVFRPIVIKPTYMPVVFSPPYIHVLEVMNRPSLPTGRLVIPSLKNAQPKEVSDE